MKEIILSIVILVTAYVPGRSFNDNIVDYTFSQTTGTFNSIHTTGTYIAAGCTSTTFGNLPIGFAFVYNGTSYSQFGLCCSGWISMGPSVPNTSAFPLSTGIANNVISPFGAQLTSSVAGDGIYYKTEGSSPSRILTVEWWQYGFWLNGFDEICFQIKLYETTNQISFVYTTNDELSIRNVQVGLRGSSNADFVNRQTTTNWSQTTAGTTNTASCLFSPGITPSAGLTFNFSPPPVSVVNINSQVPESFALYQNYPNPFNPSTSIRFSLPSVGNGRDRSYVQLIIYDILSREIAVLVNEQLQPGTYETNWNASNYSSGIYYYTLKAGDFSETKKMILIK
jgi:hypothetical protein